MERPLGVNQAADFLGFSRSKVYKLVTDGQLKAIRVPYGGKGRVVTYRTQKGTKVVKGRSYMTRFRESDLREFQANYFS